MTTVINLKVGDRVKVSKTWLDLTGRLPDKDNYRGRVGTVLKVHPEPDESVLTSMLIRVQWDGDAGYDLPGWNCNNLERIPSLNDLARQTGKQA